MATTVPTTLDGVLDPAWLSEALAPSTGGARVTAVETVEVLRTMATKVRFVVTFEDAARAPLSLCIKAFLDVDEGNARSTNISVREADFYTQIAPMMPIRTVGLIAALVDREAKRGLIIMPDLIAAGNRFCTALEAFTPDQVAASLEQLAMVHATSAAPGVLDRFPWIVRKVPALMATPYVTPEMLQDMLNGPRGVGLPDRTRDASLLLRGLPLLDAEDRNLPEVLLHGDSHAGNIFLTKDGPGLIDWQSYSRGGWALDVAYHIAATLAVDVAEREERTLVRHYLDTVRRFGGQTPSDEEAWLQYRMSPVYGFYMWSITRRVEPTITNTFVNRLGSSVTRHESYRLLGL